MCVENPFIAKARLLSLRKYLPVSQTFPKTEKGDNFIPRDFFFDEFPKYGPISKLSDNIGESMRMMAAIQALKESLPGIDCGACGAPTCRAFAEDVVKGEARIKNCKIRTPEDAEK